jgi:hypothetical protein
VSGQHQNKMEALGRADCFGCDTHANLSTPFPTSPSPNRIRIIRGRRDRAGL